YGLVDARPIKLNAHHAAGRNVRLDDTLQSPELFSEPLGKSRVHGQVDPSQKMREPIREFEPFRLDQLANAA
ncbi:hypothetical protein, partial [Klebsiella pneumoniae]|uniref:hypothetical protein n=1 Tax=Klebsiella pneumoniae TaxID=573 RepID=UPI0013D5B2F3